MPDTMPDDHVPLRKCTVSGCDAYRGSAAITGSTCSSLDAEYVRFLSERWPM